MAVWGIIDMVGNGAETPTLGGVAGIAKGGAEIPPFDNVAPAHPVLYHSTQPLPQKKEKKKLK